MGISQPGAEALPHPFTVRPLGELLYLDVKEPFNPLAMLRSPMILIMLVMVLFAVLLPRCMAMIDPEELKQAQEEMARTASGGGSASR